MKFNKIIDISVDLNKKTVVYPGTPEMVIEETKSTATGSQLSKITFSSHIGTHIDAPLHAIAGGISLDQINLEKFIGTCRVVDMQSSKPSISTEDVKKTNPQKGERILFKTSNSERGLETFYEDFVFLSPEAASHLATSEVSLVGIDYFSIKQKGSTDNRPHTELLAKNIPIVEGINLKDVEPGEYFLIALPLKFIGTDGSPARVVLLQ
ncbi:hypothetical protein A3G67_02570 [Candidatus Roizmanbacteria bacterium RIFCSPLOWO2_12_FULL_40_12]|uniref:Kynurenine formamidase n=1 Tax=Candidatus Roizmanbacteria bacterium RIFCSPLOWO2_01_FULL_40_42 TaxID=1802066 RepID=A0A1F7J650_9BACT|nr:MAG: hypothetical protein A2779_03860 [Candidatus Roizmanbacteria bacterium RIFCSPHIGHO2_01_FULL_40_98]OGK27866.1 MAG: hypothetical protein A3C31_03825 [Candidatus Roizmanbacteria bacterium RIFCSPHIGHO2_02_FULL_40_53]OGK29417.1 MAG: hypothetical protein A2W49_04190 [Candidatus Roizmanbacteria bacterium RIFCSPHIGHO2_12_41_18]OGK36620.1 MAG: hypothetical protein A3E69_00095 [Candidatus Roizmanbacteria bacterium RIFCSPHIGHO2_12_FULL_40_130]OGK51058.1 MAG: hypothetical protein A3B50_02745 [Candi